MSNYVRITEVAPRDGLQNEPAIVATESKRQLVRVLEKTGVDEIEVTSFVRPGRVPQLADAEQLVGMLAADKPEGMLYSALVPNEQGLERLLEVNSDGPVINKIAVFTAASETFAQKNINASIDESITRFRPVIDMARQGGLMVRAYISCAFVCPFEGPVAPATVTHVAARLLALGVDEIDVADTIGAATPEHIESVIAELFHRLGPCRDNEIGDPCLTLHLHDTHGSAAACVRKALSMGVRSFDSSAGGLGGCPFAGSGKTRAPGNIATELLVRTITEAGYRCGVDSRRLEEATKAARDLVAREPTP
ncbi:MAG: hydroxymethylglutaryl-CoA lyase [Phycisphaerales bacterium]|nr:hydroxymethylglutaryl-CoA lyase [Phycisphaerales bacterium]